MSEVTININIAAGNDTPKVEVKKPIPTKLNKKHNKAGGVLQFPEHTSENNSILSMMGIKET